MWECDGEVAGGFEVVESGGWRWTQSLDVWIQNGELEIAHTVYIFCAIKVMFMMEITNTEVIYNFIAHFYNNWIKV